jgi:dihydropteroate synthase
VRAGLDRYREARRDAPAVLAAGASMINDINACGAGCPGGVAAARMPALCLMHMQGKPATMQNDPHYEDVVAEVRDFLGERVAAAQAAGIALNASRRPRLRLRQEPGTQPRTAAPPRRVVARAGGLLLAGMSRKSMLGEITGRAVRSASGQRGGRAYAGGIGGANPARA